MAYRYTKGILFKAVVNNKIYKFTCFSQNTRNGFRHVCYRDLYFYPYKGLKPLAKCNYLNRTWERWAYQSVLREAIEKLYKNKEVNKKEYDFLIDSLIERKHTDNIKISYIQHIIDRW